MFRKCEDFWKILYHLRLIIGKLIIYKSMEETTTNKMASRAGPSSILHITSHPRPSYLSSLLRAGAGGSLQKAEYKFYLIFSIFFLFQILTRTELEKCELVKGNISKDVQVVRRPSRRYHLENLLYWFIYQLFKSRCISWLLIFLSAFHTYRSRIRGVGLNILKTILKL